MMIIKNIYLKIDIRKNTILQYTNLRKNIKIQETNLIKINIQNTIHLNIFHNLCILTYSYFFVIKFKITSGGF